MERTIIALYDDLATAQRVVQNLVNEGFSRDSISLMANDASNRYSQFLKSSDTTTTTDSDVDLVGPGEGATFGAVIGGLTGVLAGLGALAIPGIGPVIAAGPIIGGLIGMTAGAATGGIVAGLVKTGVPEEDAHVLAEGVRRGGTLVVVHSDDDKAESAYDIMGRENPVDITRRSEEWKRTGWQGFSENAEPMKHEEITQIRSSADTQEHVLPVVEEELQVGKREVQHGGVRVYSHVTETPVQEQVKLREERVNVDRRPVNRPASQSDLDKMKDQSFAVTTKSEEPVVSKQARVVEEVRINKEVEERNQTVRDTVRRTDVQVDQSNSNVTSGANTASTDYSTYDTDFRRHFDANLNNSGYTYDQIAPVYRYGYDLGASPRYTGKDWTSVEREAQEQWQERNPDTPWERFKDAIQYAWDKARSKMS